MTGSKSRREIQVQLRAALISELATMRLPQDGRHLGRVARSLVHESVELLLVAGIPKAAVAQLIVETMKKALRRSASTGVGALGQPVVTGKA